MKFSMKNPFVTGIAMYPKLFKCLVVLLAATLIGCASTIKQYPSDAAAHKQTQTGVRIGASEIGIPTKASVEYIRVKTEKSIFLDPPEGDTTVFLRVGDNSGRQWAGISIRDLVERELQQRGFQVVRGARASYALQVNILLADEVSAAELAGLDETKYGRDISGIVESVLSGVAVGGVAGSLVGNSGDALAGAAAGGIVGGLLKDLSDSRKRELLQAQQATKFFSIIMDVEVRERTAGGAIVTRTGETNISNSQYSGANDTLADTATESSQSVSSTETDSYTEETTWKRHRTRLIGKAKGKLVVFEDVEQDFALSMAKAIGGFF